MTNAAAANAWEKAQFDIVIIGAGIAGASVAAELSERHRVLLLEREDQPGYHTTGRSAALYTVAYGPPLIRALSRASGAFFHDPGLFGPEARLLSKRGVVFVARADQLDAMASLRAELGEAVTSMSGQQVAEAIPILRKGYAVAGLFDASASDIDVNGLHQHYLRILRAGGGVVLTGAEVIGLQPGSDWYVETTKGTFTAPIVVNAAGAWADEIARLAGIPCVGLAPKLRTALIVAAPDGMVPDGWPMAVDAEEQFYLKADAGKLLISPADEVPSAPCDAQPDEMQVAICIDRIERAFDLSVRRIESKWAGLRSFLPDGVPLAAYAPEAPGFFWLAGQGGYGIQTAPAMARAAAALIEERALPTDIADAGVSAEELGQRRTGLMA